MDKELRIDHAIDDQIEFDGAFKRTMLDNDTEYRKSLFDLFKSKVKGRRKPGPKIIRRGQICQRKTILKR